LIAIVHFKTPMWMFGLSSPEMFERWEGETASVVAACANRTWNKWDVDQDLARLRGKFDGVEARERSDSI
jgi:hypothetical protein